MTPRTKKDIWRGDDAHPNKTVARLTVLLHHNADLDAAATHFGVTRETVKKWLGKVGAINHPNSNLRRILIQNHLNKLHKEQSA